MVWLSIASLALNYNHTLTHPTKSSLKRQKTQLCCEQQTSRTCLSSDVTIKIQLDLRRIDYIPADTQN